MSHPLLTEKIPILERRFHPIHKGHIPYIERVFRTGSEVFYVFHNECTTD